jgi:hypothetical protein
VSAWSLHWVMMVERGDGRLERRAGTVALGT